MQMSDSALSTHPLRGWRSASWLKPRSTRVGRYGDSLRGRGSSWIPGWSLRFSEEKGHMKLRLKHEETMALYDHITWFYQQHCDIVDFDTDSLKPLIIRFLHPVGFGCFDDSTNSTNMHLLWDSCHFWGVLGPFEIPQTWDLFSSKVVGSKEKHWPDSFSSMPPLPSVSNAKKRSEASEGLIPTCHTGRDGTATATPKCSIRIQSFVAKKTIVHIYIYISINQSTVSIYIYKYMYIPIASKTFLGCQEKNVFVQKQSCFFSKAFDSGKLRVKYGKFLKNTSLFVKHKKHILKTHLFLNIMFMPWLSILNPSSTLSVQQFFHDWLVGVFSPSIHQ